MRLTMRLLLHYKNLMQAKKRWRAMKKPTILPKNGLK